MVWKRLFAPQRRIRWQNCFPFISPGYCSLLSELTCARRFSPSHTLISPGNYCSAQTSSIKKILIIKQLLGRRWSPLVCSDVLNEHHGWKRDDLPTPSTGSQAVVRTTRWCPPHRFWDLLSVCPCMTRGDGSSAVIMRRGQSLLARTPAASPSTPSSELHIAKKPFSKYTSLLLVALSLVLNDKYFIKCLPSSLCSMCGDLNRFIQLRSTPNSRLLFQRKLTFGANGSFCV